MSFSIVLLHDAQPPPEARCRHLARDSRPRPVWLWPARPPQRGDMAVSRLLLCLTRAPSYVGAWRFQAGAAGPEPARPRPAWLPHRGGTALMVYFSREHIPPPETTMPPRSPPVQCWHNVTGVLPGGAGCRPLARPSLNIEKGGPGGLANRRIRCPASQACFTASHFHRGSRFPTPQEGFPETHFHRGTHFPTRQRRPSSTPISPRIPVLSSPRRSSSTPFSPRKPLLRTPVSPRSPLSSSPRRLSSTPIPPRIPFFSSPRSLSNPPFSPKSPLSSTPFSSRSSLYNNPGRLSSMPF